LGEPERARLVGAHNAASRVSPHGLRSSHQALSLFASGRFRQLGRCRVTDGRPCLHATDGDPPRLHRLGHLARQLDMEQAMLEPGLDHLDVIGELEVTGEAAIGDTAMQIAPCALGLAPLAGDDELPRNGRDSGRGTRGARR
jgi:hypothetical protein